MRLKDYNQYTILNSSGLGLNFMPDISPAAANDVTIDDPPYEKNGSVIPITGVIPIHMPILINDWKQKDAATPKHISISKVLVA
jgi:hypothetical protein